jgi:hypothetical protein
MIDRNHDLSITGQAKALGISRGSVYYLPRTASAADLALMRRMDELHLDHPFAGSRMLQGLLMAEGHSVGRLHVATLMKRMCIEAIYRRPNTSKPEPGHKIYPYLLRNIPVTRPNQVWATDIIPGSSPGTGFTFRWRKASSISSLSSTGLAAACCLGGSRLPWTRPSALRRLRKRWLGMVNPKSSTPSERLS